MARTASPFSSGNVMQRKILIGIVVAVALSLPAVAFAASRKPLVIHPWHGYGFLPGYHQPPSNNVPIYGPKGAIGDTGYAPRYWYDGGLYYFGRPGFSGGRYNGGSFGPCWTHTPIGLIWNCG